MHPKTLRHLSLAVILVLMLGGGMPMARRTQAQGPALQDPLSPQAAVGTAFTYQGHLTRNGDPVDSTCDFKFTLCGSSAGSDVIGSTQTKSSVPGSRFVHRATAANITGNWTAIDHPLTNDNPNAIVLVTQSYNPGGVGGVFNPHPIGVWYNGDAKKWAILNQDFFAAMPDGAAFNVLIPTAAPSVFVHTATAANITGRWTIIDHPLTNDDRNAIVLVTQNYNPGGGSGMLNNYPIAVLYYGVVRKWVVVNQDSPSMPDGVHFNVLVATPDSAAFVHTATPASITSNWTTIDHPLTNDNPYAIVLVTQLRHWNPDEHDGVFGGSPTYSGHPIGVRYIGSTGKWAIFNEDLASMTTYVDFNVIVIGCRLRLPLVLRGT